MYSLARNLPLKSLAAEQLPALVVSMFTAELFFKWHSFTLECVGFLATWYALDRARVAVLKLRRRSAE